MTAVLTRRLAGLLGGLLVLIAPSNGWAYRLFVSTDAAVADPNEVGVELGYFTLEQAKGEKSFTIPSLVLNYGLGRNLELVGELRIERDPAGAVDVVDPGMSIKMVLKEGVLQEKQGVSIAVEAGPLLPSTRQGERGFGFEASALQASGRGGWGKYQGGRSRTTLRCSASSGSPWQQMSSWIPEFGGASAAALQIGNSRPA